MRKTVIIGLIFALLVTIFAIRNDEVVSLYFLWGDPIQGSLSLILIFTVLLGVLVGYAFSFPAIRKFKKENETLKEEQEKISKAKEKKEEAAKN